MTELRRFVATSLIFSGLAAIFAIAPPTSADAEIFFCESTRGPNGSAKYCNFLLFDNGFTRHRQVIVAQGARRDVPINGRYDVFCVLVQNTRGVPDNIAYRTQQCRKSDTGREYKVPIRALNMRRGRDGFSTDAVNSAPRTTRW
ncbi:hypothetical protein [Labrenzia sp. VG12]|uniref:hypothetical protein n=1 Tax=Labrenzia sp. VG12 TaxID=2021862 RepID=UPI000B8BBFFE|nr:hypothetical protein [Labrenzia sp. VG12]ASP32145.1 hypothetical protein CHH27_01915 [Labrenzia sp. VG12]